MQKAKWLPLQHLPLPMFPLLPLQQQTPQFPGNQQEESYVNATQSTQIFVLPSEMVETSYFTRKASVNTPCFKCIINLFCKQISENEDNNIQSFPKSNSNHLNTYQRPKDGSIFRLHSRIFLSCSMRQPTT